MCPSCADSVNESGRTEYLTLQNTCYTTEVNQAPGLMPVQTNSLIFLHSAQIKPLFTLLPSELLLQASPYEKLFWFP